MFKKLLLIILVIFYAVSCMTLNVEAAEVGLVTVASSRILLQDGTAPARELKAFIKVRIGDRITLPPESRLQLVFFENGRQETWSGSGMIEVGGKSAKVVKGKPDSKVKTVPDILVKQLSKTPSPDGVAKAGMIRVRSIASSGITVESAENHYIELRRVTDADDLTPEAFLLSSYLELRELAKLEQLLDRLNQQKTTTVSKQSLDSVYRQALLKAKQ